MCLMSTFQSFFLSTRYQYFTPQIGGNLLPKKMKKKKKLEEIFNTVGVPNGTKISKTNTCRSRTCSPCACALEVWHSASINYFFFHQIDTFHYFKVKRAFIQQKNV